MELGDQVLSFFLWFGLVYAMGTVVGLYVRAALRGVWYRKGGKHAHGKDETEDGMGEIKEKKKGDEEEPCSWYDGLRKPRWLPGSLFYLVAWLLAYFIVAYVSWRVWIADAARTNSYGEAFEFLSLLHLVLLAVWPVAFYGYESFFWGGLVLFFLLGSVAVNLWLLSVVTLRDSLMGLTPFILLCIYAAWLLVVLILFLALLYKNRRRLRKADEGDDDL